MGLSTNYIGHYQVPGPFKAQLKKVAQIIWGLGAWCPWGIDRLGKVKEDDRALLGCRSRACCPRPPVGGGSRLFLGLAHPSLHVKGGWDAKNAARPEADAPRYRSDLKRPGSACGIPIEQERSKWQCWVAGAWLSLRWSIPELLNRADQPASSARSRKPAPISSVSCLRSGDPPRLRTKHIFQSSARERPAACRRTHPSCPLFRGDLQLLFSPSRSLLGWWRVAECSYENAFGTDSEPGAEDLGACRSPTLVAQK